MKGTNVGAGVGKDGPAADIGTVVLILDVSELFMGPDDCDVISREGTGTGISVVITVGADVCCVTEETTCVPLTCMVVCCTITLLVGNWM